MKETKGEGGGRRVRGRISQSRSGVSSSSPSSEGEVTIDNWSRVVRERGREGWREGDEVGERWRR